LELKIMKSNDIYIIDVNGEMDLYNSYKLKDLVIKMLDKKVNKFIINLNNDLSHGDTRHRMRTMTKAIEEVFDYIGKVMDKTLVCEACRDKTRCSACVFNRN